MSKAKLRKELAALDAAALREVILELYDARKEAKEYLEFWMDPDAARERERCEALLCRQFFSSSGRAAARPRLSACTKIIKDYRLMTHDTDGEAALLTAYAETYCRWVGSRRSRLGHKGSLERVVAGAEAFVESADLETNYSTRLRKCRDAMETLFKDRPPRRRWFF